LIKKRYATLALKLIGWILNENHCWTGFEDPLTVGKRILSDEYIELQRRLWSCWEWYGVHRCDMMNAHVAYPYPDSSYCQICIVVTMLKLMRGAEESKDDFERIEKECELEYV